MKRSWCLLIGSVCCFFVYVLHSMVGLTTLGIVASPLAISGLLAICVLMFAGYLFNAKPAAAAAGLVAVVLYVYEPSFLTFSLWFCMLSFAGWSKIRKEEIEMLGRRANRLDDDEWPLDKDQQECYAERELQKYEERKAQESTPTMPEAPKQRLEDIKPIRTSSSEEKKQYTAVPQKESIIQKIKDSWYFMDNGTKAIIKLVGGTVAILLLVIFFLT